MDPRKTAKEILAGFEINLPEIYQAAVIEAMIAGMVTARGEERRDWAHALKQAVESQFPDWGDFHEWPATPDVETVCAWLKKLIQGDRTAICAELEQWIDLHDPHDLIGSTFRRAWSMAIDMIRERGEK